MKGRRFGDFHEWTLVAFTAMSIAGAGLAPGRGVAAVLAGVSWVPRPAEAAAVAFLIGTGMIVSALHLGRRERMLIAWRGIGHSRLSLEAGLALLVSGSALATAVLLGFGLAEAAGPIWAITVISAAAFLCSLGWVYSLPGQLFWKGPAFVSPLLLGTSLGLSKLVAGTNFELGGTLLLVLGLDAVIFIVRGRSIQAASRWGHPAHPQLFRVRHWIVVFLLLMIPVLPISLISAAPRIAFAFLILGLVFDRFTFYALALEHTPEAEIARLEEIITAG
jgi:DMSO reductase anchor subunit